MNRERVLVTTIDVTRKTQIVVFQIKIPRNAKNIIGVELGLNIKTMSDMPGGYMILEPIPFSMKRNNIVGDIKLKSLEEANLFYADEIKIDNNLSLADFTVSGLWPTPSTHGPSMNEVNVKVTGKTTTVQGIYKDRLIESYPEGDYRVFATYTYQVKVYLWIEKKEKGENK